jgi:hypothetical protein
VVGEVRFDSTPSIPEFAHACKLLGATTTTLRARRPDQFQVYFFASSSASRRVNAGV